MVSGFGMVYKTDWFLLWFGDLGEAFGAVNARWMSWKLAGAFLIFLGFIITFNLHTRLLDTIAGMFG